MKVAGPTSTHHSGIFEGIRVASMHRGRIN